MTTKLTETQIEAAARWCAGLLLSGDTVPRTESGLFVSQEFLTWFDYINDMNTARRLREALLSHAPMPKPLADAWVEFPSEAFADCPAAIYNLGVALGAIEEDEQ